MQVEHTGLGFEIIKFEVYDESDKKTRLVQQSSAIGDYHDALARPGSSFLWIGRDHHLDREQVQELITHLQQWLDTGSLAK